MASGIAPRPMLSLFVLGRFSAQLASYPERELALTSRLHRVLLAYLALQPEMVETRERLAALIWGESGEIQAQQNLRQCLLRLRRDLNDAGLDILHADKYCVRLDMNQVRCDARELPGLCASGIPGHLDAVVDLYRGRLLEGMSLQKESFDAWLNAEAEKAERLAVVAMRIAGDSHFSAKRSARAVTIAERLLGIDASDEAALRLLLRALWMLQGRQAALHRADTFRAWLSRELGCEPEPETLALIAELHEWPVVVAVAEKPFPHVPEGPSIAVLPFANIGGDQQSENFADGIAEDITTALSRLRWLFVIARSSTFTYKGAAVDVRQVARELGVRYILEGSTRIVGSRIRVSAQLVNAASGMHVWANHYDRELGDFFNLQDDIAEHVVAALEPNLFAQEGFRASSVQPDNLDSWGLVVTAVGLVHRFERVANEKAQELLRKALTLDPAYTRARAILAWALFWHQQLYGDSRRLEVLQEAYAHAALAMREDTSEPWARMVLGFIESCGGNHRQGIEELQIALQLNPGFALARMLLGWIHIRAGDHDLAIENTAKALRLSPLDNFSGVYQATHGLALLAASRFGKALPYLQASIKPYPENVGHYNSLISCCGHLGLLEEAERLLAYRRKLTGRELTLRSAREWMAGFAHRDVFIEGLAKAGVSETTNPV
jgi:adenylate cyclase